VSKGCARLLETLKGGQAGDDKSWNGNGLRLPPGRNDLYDRYLRIVEQWGEWRWVLWAGLALVGVLIVAWILDQVWKRAVIPITEKTRTNLDGLVARGVRRPLTALVFFGGLSLCAGAITHRALTSAKRNAESAKLRAETAQFRAEALAGSAEAQQARAGAERASQAVLDAGHAVEFWERGLLVRLVKGALYILMVLAACAAGYGLVTALCDWYLLDVASKTSTTLDDEFIPVFRRMAKVVVFFVALTIILGHFDVKITALLGAAGFASLAVALAAQETVANMISGFTILVDRPFRVGDRVELADGTVGDVCEIGLRSTKILSFDSTQLIIPNKQISAARIINHSYPDTKVKIRKDYGVAYGSDVELVKRILVEICRAHPKVLDDPEAAVYFTDFADSALIFKLVCWVSDYKDKFATTDEINTEINRRFNEEKIEIPFPQRDIHVRSGAVA